MRKLVFLVLVTFVIIAFFISKKAPTSRPAVPAPVAAKAVPLVPPPPADLDLDIQVAPAPEVTGARIIRAMQNILALGERPGLQHPDDVKIRELLRRYESGAQAFEIGALKVQVSEKASGRLAFRCDSTHRFVYLPGLKLTDELLMVSVYHELAHAVECVRQQMGAPEPPPCEGETENGWAAQIRFMDMMIHEHRIPLVMGPQDASVLQQTMDVWPELARGNFCGWYRKALATGSDAPPSSEHTTVTPINGP